MENFNFARPAVKEQNGGQERQKFELHNDLVRFQFKIVATGKNFRKHVTLAYARFVSELAQNPDYLPVYVAKRRCQLGTLLAQSGPSPLCKSFWVNTVDYMVSEEKPNNESLYSCFSTALDESESEHYLDIDT